MDRRKNSRHTIRDDVTLVVLGIANSDPCTLENISRGGAKFYSTTKLAVGNRVELRVPSTKEEPELVIQAKILRLGPGDHNKPFGYACVIENVENFDGY